MENSHKRTHSKVESNPTLEKDSEAKRPSRNVSNPSVQSAPPVDCATESSLSTEDVLAYISFDDLKTVFRNVLADADAGLIASRELLAYTDNALAFSREQARKECMAIVREAANCYENAVDEAMEMRGMATSSDIPLAVQHCLPRARALLKRGHMTHGPELAWKAVLQVCQYATYEWDGGDARFQEGEDGCDWFHERVDDLLLAILRVQEEQDNTAWLGQERLEDVRKLQQIPQQPCTYRYPKTLEFLGSEATLQPNPRYGFY